MSHTRPALAASLLAALVSVALFAAPAAAGGSPKLRIAKHEEGPYGGGFSANLVVGKQKTWFLKAKSTGTDGDPATLEDQSTLDSEYNVKYFRGTNNITDEVQAGGYDFTIGPRAKRFLVKVKATIGPPSPDCLIVVLDAGVSDVVLVSVNGGKCPIV